MVHQSDGTGALNVSFMGTALCLYKLAIKPTRNDTWWKLMDKNSELMAFATSAHQISDASQAHS
jgi:hypothetical protein